MIKPRIPVINWRHPIAKGLVLDALMVERGGLSVYDWSLGNIGTLSSQIPGYDVYGPILKFTGSQSVNFGNFDQYNFTKGVTITAIIRPDNVSPNNTIISKRSVWSSTGIPFEFTKDGALMSFRVVGNSRCDTLSIISANTQYHVAATWDGSLATVYVNASNSATLSVSGPITTNSQSVYIGQLPGGGENFSGNISEVKLWNRPLSQREISILYQNPFVLYKYPPLFTSLNTISTSAAINIGYRMLLGVGY